MFLPPDREMKTVAKQRSNVKLINKQTKLMLRDVSTPLPAAKGLAGPRRTTLSVHGILILKSLIKVILCS